MAGRVPQRFGDYLLLLGAACLATFVNGPSSIVALFGVFVNVTTLGRFRLALLPTVLSLIACSTYVLINVPQALRDTPKFASDLLIVTTRLTCFISVLFWYFVDKLVFPLDVVLPRGNGKYNAARFPLSINAAGTSLTVHMFYPVENSYEGIRVPYFYYGPILAKGFARFLKLPSILFSWMRYIKGWSYDADPDIVPPIAMEYLEGGGATTATQSKRERVVGGKVPEIPTRSNPNPQSMPLVLFSHGLGGSPDCYSSQIAEFVSQGCVVAALEHNDGSAAYAYSYNTSMGRYYEFLTPSERNNRSKEYKRRSSQLKQRARELVVTLDVLRMISKQPRWDHEPVENVEPSDIRLARLLFGDGLLDVSHVTAVGHSFGASTCIHAAELSSDIHAVIALDPWAFPLSSETLRRGVQRVPILAIMGEGFARWEENQVAMRMLLDPYFRVHFDSQNIKQMEKSEMKSETAIVGCNGVSNRGEVHPLFTPILHASVDSLKEYIPSLVNNYQYTIEAAACKERAGFWKSVGVHPGSVLIALRDIYHQSFSDFGVLLPHLCKLKGNIGKSRQPLDEIKLIRSFAIEFLWQCREQRHDELMSPKDADSSLHPTETGSWRITFPSALQKEILYLN